MQSDIHPNYRPVVFLDTNSGESFVTQSTIETEETTTWEDGNEYPLAKVEISSSSHPFFTGTMTIVDTAGRVERFEKRYGTRRKARKAAAEAPAAEAPAEAAVEEAAPEPAPAPEPVAEEAAPVAEAEAAPVASDEEE